MSWMKIAWMALFAGVVMLGAGCVDNSVPDEDSIPKAWSGPGQNGGLNFDDPRNGGFLVDGEGFGPGATESSVNADTWQKIPGRLGFPNIYYSYDSDALGAQEQAKLDVVAKYLADQPQLVLIIEGNCDERGTEEYNRALGERRAISVKNYLMNKGVADARMRTISFGKDNPAVQGSGESVWAQNRRAELCPATVN